jgi:hypothetical protein
MTHNLAPQPLSRAQLDKLPPGQHVIDADMDISTKRADGLWVGYEMGPITTAKLAKYGPVKLWTGPVRA